MPYNDDINTSIKGRRLGLQFLSSGQTGGSRGKNEFLVGPDAFRMLVTTAETTSTNLKAHGVSYLVGTSAASSAVYTIDPPIPGVMKIIAATSANGPVHLKTANDENIHTISGSSWTTIEASSSCRGAFLLIGMTTAIWLGMALTSGTSEFELTTST